MTANIDQWSGLTAQDVLLAALIHRPELVPLVRGKLDRRHFDGPAVWVFQVVARSTPERLAYDLAREPTGAGSRLLRTLAAREIQVSAGDVERLVRLVKLTAMCEAADRVLLPDDAILLLRAELSSLRCETTVWPMLGRSPPARALEMMGLIEGELARRGHIEATRDGHATYTA